MGSKTRRISYCTKRGDDTVNLVTSHKTNARLARPIQMHISSSKDSNINNLNKYKFIIPNYIFNNFILQQGVVL